MEKFIETFAFAEAALFDYVGDCAKMEGKYRNALLSGIHTDQLINFVRRLWRARPPAGVLKRLMDDALNHFKSISDIRNLIVHNPSYIEGDRARGINTRHRSLRGFEFRELRLSSFILDDLTFNLEKIIDSLRWAAEFERDRYRAMDLSSAGFYPLRSASWRDIPAVTEMTLQQRQRLADRKR